MPIAKFNTANATALLGDLNKALAMVAKHHGIDLALKHKEGNPNNLEFSLKASVIDAAGEVVNQEKIDFLRYCGQFGLDATYWHKVFIFRGRRYKVDGINPGAWKYAVSATRQPDGKRFKFPVNAVKPGARAPFAFAA